MWRAHAERVGRVGLAGEPLAARAAWRGAQSGRTTRLFCRVCVSVAQWSGMEHVTGVRQITASMAKW